MTLSEYYSELMNHDWFHYYSDDFSVYKRGERNWGILCQIAKESPEHTKLFDEWYEYKHHDAPKPIRPE